MSDVLTFPPKADEDDPLWTASRTFRQRLAASTQIQALARMIGIANALYEGRRQWGCYTPSVVHQQAAELAVRWSSEEARTIAMSQALQHGVRLFDELEHRLRSSDTTPDRRLELIRDFIRACIGVREFHLLHEAGRSEAEWQAFESDEERVE